MHSGLRTRKIHPIHPQNSRNIHKTLAENDQEMRKIIDSGKDKNMEI
jgi:hypothetical protein